MKMTPDDMLLFKTLARGDLGKQLANYLDRVADAICDSRNWKEGDTRESTTKSAEYIKSHIRDKISFGAKKEDGRKDSLGDYE